jgi:flavin reductase (DIM6/NTAB) family NADH-FMN oxidoreductase RutF
MVKKVISGSKYAYRVLHPKIPVLIATVDREGKVNVAAFSWITTVSADPFIVTVSVAERRYTYNLLEQTGEFTVNIPTLNLLSKVWVCGSKSGRNEDKIKLTGFKLTPSHKIKAPIIDDCIANLECKVINKIKTGDHIVFFGEVLEIYVEEKLFSHNIWNPDDVKILLHLGGSAFTTVNKLVKAE